MLLLELYLGLQGDLLKQSHLGQVKCIDYEKFLKISLIISRLSDLFCLRLILVRINQQKFLVPILKSLTSNEYTVNDSLAFTDKIAEKDSKFLC